MGIIEKVWLKKRKKGTWANRENLTKVEKERLNRENLTKVEKERNLIK